MEGTCAHMVQIAMTNVQETQDVAIYLVVHSPIGIWKTPAVCTRPSVMSLPLQQKVVENYRGPSLCRSLGHTYEALYPFRCSSFTEHWSAQ